MQQKSLMSCFFKPIFVVLLIFSGLIGIVWLRSNITSLEYMISEFESVRTERMKETKMLLAERSSLLSMQRVEKTAVRNLGLVFPDRTKVVHVTGEKKGPQHASYEIVTSGSGSRGAGGIR